MQTKIIFLDIDGTLVNFKGQISNSTKTAIRQAKENGHKLLICSGRSQYQIYDELLELGFDGIVGGAGAFVVCENEEIYHNFIAVDKCKTLFDYLESNGFAYTAQCDNGTMMNQRCLEIMEKLYQKMGITEKQLRYLIGAAMIREDLWNYPKVEKVIYHNAPFSVAQVQQDLAPDFDVTALSIDRITDDAGEIGVSGINKATGMKRYIEHIGALQEDTIAIGDGPNDYEMVEFAAIGVAMGNATPELKEWADMVTADIDNNGIYRAFETLGLI